MKLLLIALLLNIALIADTIIVSASVDGKGYKAKKKAKKEAKKKAIKKYILNNNKNISSDILDDISAEYPEYILSSTLQDINFENGRTDTIYEIEVDQQLINKKLASLGQKIQGLATDFIIIEEPLDLDTIDFFSKQDFIIYYKILQRNIHNIINKKMNDNGFSIKSLDNNNFNKFKQIDPQLTGVYYSHKRSKFIKNKEFHTTVQKNYPNAIAIKYKVEFLTIINSSIKATLSLNLLDMATNNTMSIGMMSYTIPLDSFSFNEIKSSFSRAIRNITSLMINDLSDKVNQLIQKRNNQPITIAINLNSKRLAYKMKRELKKDNNHFDLVISNTNIKFFAKNPDTEAYLYEILLPLVEDILNVKIKDSYISIKGRNLIINTTGKEFKQKNIKIIFI